MTREEVIAEFEQMAEQICDNYCKYPDIWDEEAEGQTLFDAVCIKCPLCKG